MKWSQLPALAALLFCGSSSARSAGSMIPEVAAELASQRAPLVATMDWGPQDQEGGAPISLTASDGSGLWMRSLQVRGLVQDPLAFTELHMVFENPEDRVVEGRFEITLPPGAAISRFAMKIEERWMEGEVVEKQKARRAYEDFLHRRQDPALLEKDAGNQFRARVFPIPAGGEKELILSYSQELDGSADPYEVMLQGLPELERLDVDLMADTWSRRAPRASHTLHKEMFQPQADLLLGFEGGPRAVGLRGGQYGVARVQPLLDESADALNGLVLLFDTSASRSLGFEAKVQRLGQLLQELASQSLPGTALQLVCFDQEVRLAYAGPLLGFGQQQQREILQRGALGASDLGAALDWAAEHTQSSRVLLVTDGIATAGDQEATRLKEQVRALSAKGVQRLDVLVDGGIRDELLLAELCRAGLPRDGVLLEASQAAAEQAQRLQRATRSGIQVQVPGAEWIWPTVLDGVQSGDELLVYARLPQGQAMQVQLTGAELAAPIAFAPAEPALLERAAVQANIERLTHSQASIEDEHARQEIVDEIVHFSTYYRVLSDYTALLVLETELDYARYGIERTALARILTIGEDGLQYLGRKEPEVLDLPVQEPVAKAKKKKNGGADHGERSFHADAEGSDDFGVTEGAEPELEEEARPEQSGALDELASSAQAPPPADPAPADSAPPPPARSARSDVASGPETRVTGRVAASEPMAERAVRRERESRRSDEDSRAAPEKADPWTGRYAEVMQLLLAERKAEALELAQLWLAESPGDVLALLALGEALEALGDLAAAARAYGSIIDLFPSRADLRRMAGERLERLGPAGLALAADSFATAVRQRPDHPSGHRLLAYALLRSEGPEQAFEALLQGLDSSFAENRFGGVRRILREDLGLVAAAWLRDEPARADEIEAALEEQGASLPLEPSTRFVLVWETDANDVDFHIYDGKRNHAYYGHRELRSGGQLYADITTGYGPECFTIEGDARAFPYTLQAKYYSRGPMGYGMGTLHVLHHDGEGGLTLISQPYVIMKDQAFVDLGVVGE